MNLLTALRSHVKRLSSAINQNGAKRLADYDFEDLTEQPTAKKTRPAVLAECSFKNVIPEDLQMVESDSESFDPEVDKKPVLAKWKQKALSSRAVNMKKTANGSSRQNRESDKPLQQTIKSSSEKKTRKPQVKKTTTRKNKENANLS